MENTYQPVEIEIIYFQTEDVITTSGGCTREGEEG